MQYVDLERERKFGLIFNERHCALTHDGSLTFQRSMRGAGLAQCLSTRLPPMWPGFDSRTRRHKWAEFVGSLLYLI